MEILILILGTSYLAFLACEYYKLTRVRKSFKHIVHVNGTRGKSTVSRLIDAGLREGGCRVFTKTTGTSPRMLYVDGSEHGIKRWGRANIKEQAGMMKKASRQQAEVLIIECMAVKPELQEISQHKLLGADISLVTNVRMDHMDEMGGTLDEIAEALSSVIPYKGRFFTADKRYFSYFAEIAAQRGSSAFLAEQPKESYKKIDFPDNVSLALSICKALGVDEQTALKGMQQYRRDPGSLRIYTFLNKNNSRISFVNAMAANDPESTEKILEAVFAGDSLGAYRILLINNRGDRMTRLQQFVDFALKHTGHFNAIWVSGLGAKLMEVRMKKGGMDKGIIRVVKDIEDFDSIEEDAVVFAAGNIAGFGSNLMKYVEKAGGSIGR